MGYRKRDWNSTTHSSSEYKVQLSPLFCFNFFLHRDFHHSPAEYTVSCFLPLETDPEMVDPVTDQAVEKNSAASLDPTEAILGHAATASVDGNVVIWSDRSLDNLFVPLEPKGLKAAIKFVKLHNTTIYSLQVFPSSLVVSAAEDGFIRVHDIQFRLVAWFEKEKRGPITHISFRSSTLANGQKAPGTGDVSVFD